MKADKQTADVPRILKLPEVIDRVGLSRSTIYVLVNRKEFPSSIKLAPRKMGWLESDINQWIDDRVEKSRSTENV